MRGAGVRADGGGDISDALTYAAMLALSEDGLADTFPRGAKSEKNRWRPALEAEKPDLTRDQLLRRRKELQERANLMPTDSTKPALRPTLQSVGRKGALGAETHTTETPLGDELPPEPEMVDPDTLERFVAENREKDAKRAAPLHERLKRLEPHAEPHQLESLERRIKGLERSLHDKAA